MVTRETKVGDVVGGKWRLTKLLGEGGMGRVFAAEGTEGQGRVAIKMLHPEYVTEPQVLQRFLNEAYAAQQFHHENVCQVYEYAQDDNGVPYLVMELLEGVSLAQYVVPGKPISAAQAAPIVYNVLQALQAAHEKGIVHRDLKPDNVFLVPDSRGRYTVKVLDFGIAKVMDVAGGIGKQTKTGVLLGTPGYMSPEQIKDAKRVDPRSDLWSVGVMFYEMLTGQEPFSAPNDFAKLTAVLTQEPRPIYELDPGLAGWSHFFVKALSRDVNRRFQSAQEMAAALLTTARTMAGAAPLPTAEFRSIDVDENASPVRESFRPRADSQHASVVDAPKTLTSAPPDAAGTSLDAANFASTLRAEDGVFARDAASNSSVPEGSAPGGAKMWMVFVAFAVGLLTGGVVGGVIGWLLG